MHYSANPVEPVELSIGDRIKLERDGDRWWTVRAVSPNFVAVVRQAPFRSKGKMLYTVLDWRNGVRGPCDLIGQGFGDGTYSEEECAEMLTGFEYDYAQDPDYLEAKRAHEAGEIDRVTWPSKLNLEVSQRNWAHLDISQIERKKS